MLQTHLKMSMSTGLERAPKIRIVIVERHAAVRHALQNRLSAVPHLEVVVAVAEPASALPYLNAPTVAGEFAAAPDVVLLGLQNGPDEELYKTLEIVQQMARCPTAVIVLAPYADEVERLLLLQAGVRRYLLKYIDSPRLIQEIEGVVSCSSDP
jgi:DNA-binding NarL/FixJ family response regulator